VILGTGVGGGIVLDGRIWSGAQGIAGEWGHMTFEPAGAECYCGRRGCVETVLSGPALERAYEDRVGSPLTGPPLTAERIWRIAAQGDAIAESLVETYRARLGFALAQVVNLLDPDVIVLGGGVSNVPDLASDALRRMRPHLFNDEIRTRLLRHELGDSAGVLGAAWLASGPPPADGVRDSD
jgi:fructokinase